MGKKQVTLASEYLLDNDESHIANTIIDGSQLPYPTKQVAYLFHAGEDTTTVLCGFTIRNGEGTLFTKDGKRVKSEEAYLSQVPERRLHTIASSRTI